ncbi:hypothetical protein [Shewanella fidelis]|nr:hypothetical protein [Shewanella fidelis]
MKSYFHLFGCSVKQYWKGEQQQAKLTEIAQGLCLSSSLWQA